MEEIMRHCVQSLLRPCAHKPNHHMQIYYQYLAGNQTVLDADIALPGYTLGAAVALVHETLFSIVALYTDDCGLETES